MNEKCKTRSQALESGAAGGAAQDWEADRPRERGVRLGAAREARGGAQPTCLGATSLAPRG